MQTDLYFHKKDIDIPQSQYRGKNPLKHFALTVVKKLNIHSDSDANIEADEQMVIASQKKTSIKSAEKVDITKG